MTDTSPDRALALLHEHRGKLLLSEWRFVNRAAALRRRGQELGDVAIAIQGRDARSTGVAGVDR